ncbi:hypothetical protein M0R45_006698 [Rubus argutus]|uniref:Uncharacterized protein n=1 Tax=Rubus argutus TaxID=59490 RepID=A0AAW1YRB7_RUBAR
MEKNLMEKIACNLNNLDLKKSSLGKSYNRFVAQSYSLLHLTGQMKDLEARYRIEHRTKIQELENREKEVGVKENASSLWIHCIQGFEIKEQRLGREKHRNEANLIRGPIEDQAIRNN